jgi:hypothetical protein
MALPIPKLEKSQILKNHWHVKAPDGWKFRLFSYGQYGMTLILEKVKEEDSALDDLNEVVDRAREKLKK